MRELARIAARRVRHDHVEPPDGVDQLLERRFDLRARGDVRAPAAVVLADRRLELRRVGLQILEKVRRQTVGDELVLERRRIVGERARRRQQPLLADAPRELEFAVESGRVESENARRALDRDQVVAHRLAGNRARSAAFARRSVALRLRRRVLPETIAVVRHDAEQLSGDALRRKDVGPCGAELRDAPRH